LDSSGNESVFASGLDDPAGLAFDGSGNLYVADSGNGTILQFNSSGNASAFASGLNDPTGLAFGNNNNLYVANSGTGTILQFNSTGNSSVFASGLGSNVDPTYLAFGNGGNLYVSTTRTIEGFDSNGNESAVFGANEFIEGLAVDNNSDLYVALQNAGFISRALGSGGPTTPLGYPFNVNVFEVNPAGLAFDNEGNLYATFTQLGYFGTDGKLDVLDGVVMEFNASGQGTVLATGLDNPEYIAVQNTQSLPSVQFVPEPSTWAMMLAGLGIFWAGCRFLKTPPLAVSVSKTRCIDKSQRKV
jgi:sugar lactone lactonase YvrE